MFASKAAAASEHALRPAAQARQLVGRDLALAQEGDADDRAHWDAVLYSPIALGLGLAALWLASTARQR